MEVDNVTSRPTIRIEIQNDCAQEMDVDENEESTAEAELEDGEVTEENDSNNEITQKNKDVDKSKPAMERIKSKWINKEGGFLTGLDVLSKEEQEKLEERAKRFGLELEEKKAITDQQLQELKDSLGITKENEKNVRFDALHIRGVEEMSTQDVFDYFKSYGPAYIEWINDFSCNVVWQEDISAIRALHGLTKQIRGMEFLDEANPFLDDSNDTPVEETKKVRVSGRSILLINETFTKDDDMSESVNNGKHNVDENNFVNASDITIPIPPGYWRYGEPHSRAKSLLLRFAQLTDRKPKKAEKLSEYYKKYGNPNFGGLRGIITESRKRKIRGYVDLDKKLEEEEESYLDYVGPVDSKNPWGSIAINWNRDDPKREIRVMEPVTNRQVVFETNEPTLISKRSVKDRIGPQVPSVTTTTHKSDNDSASETSDSEWRRKRKIPRMRMYADEIQDRVKRLKAVKRLAGLTTKSLSDSENHDLTVNKPTHVSPLKTNDTKESHKADLRQKLGKISKSNEKKNYMDSPEEQKTLQQRLGKKNRSERDSDELIDNSKLIRQRSYENIENDYEDDEMNDIRRKSTVKIVVRKPAEPKIASTVTTMKMRQNSRRPERRHEDYNRRNPEKGSFRSRESDLRISKPYKDRNDGFASSRPQRKLSDREFFRSSDSNMNEKKKRVNIRTTIKQERASDSSESETESDSDSSSDSSSSSGSSKESVNKSKLLSEREMFKKGGNVKKSLELASKDTLRIEVDNELYRKTKIEK